MRQQQTHHQQGGGQQNSQVGADFPIAADRQNGAAAQQYKVAHKTDPRQGHEHDGHPLDHGRVEVPKTGIVRRKTTQTHGGAHVHEGIGPAHAGPAVSQQARARKQKVHAPQAPRRFGNAGGELGVFHGARRFGLVKLHAAQSQHGQHRHHQQHDAQPANELQKATPNIDRNRQMLKPRQSRGARGGERAHGLKVGFEPSDFRHQKHKGHGGVGRQNQPHHVD